jgi:hypothetical protein
VQRGVVHNILVLHIGPLLNQELDDEQMLESILWNRFGQNLWVKPNFVTRKFVIMTVYGFKIQNYCPLY